MKMILFFMLFVMTVHAGERNVLIEVFTNSHCGNCPAAHAAIKSYASTSSYAQRIRYIYYHTLFPYNDDQLAQANTTEPVARYNFYGASSSTPITFFDGTNQGTAYSSWAANLNSRFAIESPIEIVLTGSRNGNTLSITASLTKTGTIDKTDLVVHAIAVEHVTYVGRNGVSPQEYVMRKMLTGTSGQAVQFGESNSISTTIEGELENVTDISKAGVMVFVQSVSSKEIFQSEFITGSVLTGVHDDEISPMKFALHQNYPNPFNPATVISYQTSEVSHVSMKVYDMLGKEVAVLVDHTQPVGSYSVKFDANRLTTGIYLYTLNAGNRTFVRKMLLLR